MRMTTFMIMVFCFSLLMGCGFKGADTYVFPDETAEHEATWLTWPHDYTYGEGNRALLEPIWIEMTKALSEEETVYIVVYDAFEKAHVTNVLTENNVSLEAIEFMVYPTDDVWMRDNGPIFAKLDGEQVILDWGFNGWGEKTPYQKDQGLRAAIGEAYDFRVIDLQEVVLEGGAIEMDGNGTGVLTRSAVTNTNRNPHLTEAEITEYLMTIYGLEQVIWLDGVEDLDITDFHIDGFLKFYDDKTLITLPEADFDLWGVPDEDKQRILSLKNALGNPYKQVILPLTEKEVVLPNGQSLGYRGSYINFYVANGVVLVPTYADANDAVAIELLQGLYPEKNVVGIDIRNLYEHGGMIHCVTQQQPTLRH